MVEKRGYVLPFTTESLLQYANPFLANDDYRPRRSHKVLDGSERRQYIEYRVARLGLAFLEWVQRKVEKSRWIEEAGGYEHEPTSLPAFKLKTKTVFDESLFDYYARTTIAQRQALCMFSNLFTNVWATA